MSDARPTADEAARALYYSGRPGFTIAGVAALLDARERELLAQVCALREAMENEFPADVGTGYRAHTPKAISAVLVQTADAARAWEAKVVKDEQHRCIGIVEYSVNEERLREKIVARIREGMQQHTNARSEAPGA